MIYERRIRWMRNAMKLLGRRKSDLSIDSSQLEIRSQFLVPKECSLLKQLHRCVGDRGFVCPKVRVIDVLSVLDASRQVDESIRLDRKTVDFLICDSSFQPLCVIQANLGRKRWFGSRDDFVYQALMDAGIRVWPIRNPNELTYDSICRRISPLLGEVRIDSPRKILRPAPIRLPRVGHGKVVGTE